MAVLEVDKVVKRYGLKLASDHVSFSVEAGEIFGLLGPNGAGKTTLIRMIMDIIRPDEGAIRALGENVTGGVKDRLAYLPEERGLYQKQKVGDVLVFLGELKGLPHHVAKKRTDEYLDRVGLLEVRKKRMRELSKGMQQKVQIAAVLLHEPALVILDEPFIGLDPANRALVIDLLKETAARGAAVILSTHLMEQVEALCSRILLIHQGREVLAGALRAVKERHADRSILIEIDGPLEGRPEVEAIAGKVDGMTRLLLREPPEKFLARLVAEGRTIRHFEHALPSLDEIFLKATGAKS